jgi:hypothetical protein
MSNKRVKSNVLMISINKLKYDNLPDKKKQQFIDSKL